MSALLTATRPPAHHRSAITPPPNRSRLRRSDVPKHEPRAATRVSGPGPAPPSSPLQGTLALAWADDTPADDRRPDSTAAEPDSGSAGRVSLLPEPSAWAGTFIQAAMEVASGLRSAGQLMRWTTPEVHALLVRRGALTARARRGVTVSSKPRLRALVACLPRAGVCEVSAVISEPDRIRAVAFRMEGLHGRWRVTELEIG